MPIRESELMKLIIVFLLFFDTVSADYYFPPNGTEEWENVEFNELGWSESNLPILKDSLHSWNTKAFIVLKSGKIAIEEYFDGFTSDSIWYWASAGKSLTSFLVGLAQENKLLDINNKTSDYLGKNWTSLPIAKEDLITIKHQLSMSCGFEVTGNLDCTLPECLTYKADAGSEWYYHNAPYTLLHQVLEAASEKKVNIFLYNSLSKFTGIEGAFLPSGDNIVFFSKPRAFARFGSLIINRGEWDGNLIMQDANYIESMISTSQPNNKSYGYLWWLNGKGECMLPGSSLVFKSHLFQKVPKDAFAALGKNGQILLIIPSLDLVVVRMGESNDKAAVSISLVNSIWDQLQAVMQQSSVNDRSCSTLQFYVSDNKLICRDINESAEICFYNSLGQIITSVNSDNNFEIQIPDELSGLVFITVRTSKSTYYHKIIL